MTTRESPQPRIFLRAPRPGDYGWIIARHGAVYAAEFGWDIAFEGLVARLVADFVASHDPARERAFIAWSGGQRVGSVFCVRDSETRAKLRLFLLEPQVRGRGLGKRLLTACLDFARDKGYADMGLWTHESHKAACALYEKAGFRLVSSVPVRSFGQDLVEQQWEIAL